MSSNESNEALVTAVQQLTSATNDLRTLLLNDYPKRGEVERKFVTKYSQQRTVIRGLVAATILTFIVFVGTIGSYSVCLTGDSNPGICEAVPGYRERIERRDMVDRINKLQDAEINRLLKRAGINPIKVDPNRGDDE